MNDNFQWDFEEDQLNECEMITKSRKWKVILYLEEDILPLLTGRDKEILNDWIEYAKEEDSDNMIEEHGEVGLGSFPTNDNILLAFKERKWKVGRYNTAPGSPYGIMMPKFKGKRGMPNLFVYDY